MNRLLFSRPAGAVTAEEEAVVVAAMQEVHRLGLVAVPHPGHVDTWAPGALSDVIISQEW